MNNARSPDDIATLCSPVPIYAQLPAAHSMDTEWFAIDADGHIAIFDSGEAGAVPYNVMRADTSEAEELCKQLSHSPISFTPDLWNLNNPAVPSPIRHGSHVYGALNTHRSAYTTSLTLFLKSPNIAHVLLQLPGAHALCSTLPNLYALEVPRMNESTLRWLHTHGHCVSCREASHYQTPFGFRGFFVYDHITENWISGPYAQMMAPILPIHIDQVPDQYRSKLRLVEFSNVRFRDSHTLQPAECFPECNAWGDRYIAVSGEEHELD